MFDTARDRRERQSRAYAASQAAFGALNFRDEEYATAAIAGRPLIVEFRPAASSRGGREFLEPFYFIQPIVALARPLPVFMKVEVRADYIHVGPIPEIRTDDAAFDAYYAVFGSPPEVIAAALDAPVRAWIARMGQNPNVSLEDSMVRSLLPTPGPENRTRVEDLAEAARMQIYFADRVAYGYEAHDHRLSRERGRAAADQWHSANEDLIAKRGRTRVGMRVFAVVVIAAIVLLFAAPVVWLLSKLGVFSLL